MRTMFSMGDSHMQLFLNLEDICQAMNGKAFMIGVSSVARGLFYFSVLIIWCGFRKIGNKKKKKNCCVS